MIKKYIKTTPVEAVQVTEDNREEVREFAFFAKNRFWLWAYKKFN